MTTVPGHNQILQKSSMTQDINQQANAPKPNPEQAEVLQQAEQFKQNTTVQNSERSNRLKRKKKHKKSASKKQKRRAASRKKKSVDGDDTGQLLDTTV